MTESTDTTETAVGEDLDVSLSNKVN